MRFLRALVLVVLILAGAGMGPVGALSSDDPYGPEQWALDTIGAEQAWATGTGEGATIAVVDTGVDLDHEDLASQIVADVSCIGADDDPAACSGSGDDDHGHGTHVAGIAAAATGNGMGVAGTAPGAKIMAVRVMQKDTTGGASGSIPDIRAGIRWAADHGADVINLSLGENNFLFRNLFGSGLTPAIEYAWEKGSIPVIAAGNLNNLFNSNSGYYGLPVVVVTATNQDDEQASYATNTGSTRWPMAAPGGETGDDGPCRADNPEGCEPLILSTWRVGDPVSDTGYAYAQGTSMAAPHVAGAAAVLRSLGLSPQHAVERLLETAKDIGPAGVDSQTGHGRLDLAAAVRGLAPAGHHNNFGSTTTSQPRPTVTAPPTTEAPVRVLPKTERRAPSTTPTTAATTTQPSTSTTAAPEPVDDLPVAAPTPTDPPGPDLGPWPVVAAILVVLAGAGVRQVRVLLFEARA